ncbi:MAG: biotin--[acetyl-CoA-carboxylase] ligase [Alphaproteobacteria bacterium]|nr:MAG: biotin--[acetyl-CoA-carboxylase] ligase [Alphaproteobacteria bacterium]
MTRDDAGAASLLSLPPAYRVVAFDRVTSTNDEAARLAADGAEDGTLVWAREQTAGRGRHGRTFISPPGNLYLSLILRPDCSPGEAAQLGFVAALAIADAIGTVTPPLMEVTFKWPNDVLLSGRKVAGILLEARTSPEGALEWLILGLGINVLSHPEKTDFPATSLVFEGADPSLSDIVVLEAFARHFLARVDTWLNDGFAPIRRAWLERAHALEQEIHVRLAHETLTGTFRDLDETGALVLDLPGGSRRIITAGDVFFPPDKE